MFAQIFHLLLLETFPVNWPLFTQLYTGEPNAISYWHPQCNILFEQCIYFGTYWMAVKREVFEKVFSLCVCLCLYLLLCWHQSKALSLCCLNFWGIFFFSFTWKDMNYFIVKKGDYFKWKTESKFLNSITAS